MSRAVLNNKGVSDATMTYTTPAGPVEGADYILVNNADAAVQVELVVSNTVTIAEGLSHKMDAKSYVILTVDKSGTEVATISANAGGITTAHGTSAQNGEMIFLTRSGVVTN